MVYRLVGVALLGAAMIGCRHRYEPPAALCPPPTSVPPAPARAQVVTHRHFIYQAPRPDSARIVVDVQSTDEPTGHLRDAVVQFRALDQTPRVYTMLEDSAMAGRYHYRLVRPGFYLFTVRRAGYSTVGDTVFLQTGMTDSAVYRTPFSGVCLD